MGEALIRHLPVQWCKLPDNHWLLFEVPYHQTLNNTSASTISSLLTSLFAEYGLHSALTANFGSQFVSKMFKKKREESGVTLTFSSSFHHQANGITLMFSSPYHHKANGIAVTVHWYYEIPKKAAKNKQSPKTGLCMYRITPLDDHLPSPYELLYGQKPRSPLPSSNPTHQSTHPANQEANLQMQTKQAEFYNKRASHDKCVLNSSEPVCVWNARKHIWEQGRIFNRQKPWQKT